MEKRAVYYKYAMDNYWFCLHDEFATAAHFLDLKSGDSFVNFAAGGIPMDKYLPSGVNYFPVEISKDFANIYNFPLCSYNNLPFANESIDKILVLASFHHSSEKERKDFFSECLRILKKNGYLIISDIIIDSLQAKWLNDFVDKYNPLGHKGYFINENSFRDSGFDGISWQIAEYFWEFNNEEEMIDFTKHLFNLELADYNTILNGIREYFGNELRFPWKLMYFILEP